MRKVAGHGRGSVRHDRRLVPDEPPLLVVNLEGSGSGESGGIAADRPAIVVHVAHVDAVQLGQVSDGVARVDPSRSSASAAASGRPNALAAVLLVPAGLVMRLLMVVVLMVGASSGRRMLAMVIEGRHRSRAEGCRAGHHSVALSRW